MDLDRISLRAAERALLIGGTGSGKSTLEEALIVDFHHRYEGSDGRVLILDSKPRFRGEHLASGRSAKRKYRNWSHGPTVPGSVVIHDPAELAMAWKIGYRIAIAQDPEGDGGDVAVPMLAECATAFFKSTRTNRPQLLAVDETMDFFRGNGAPVGGNNILVRVARAGRERGCGALYGTQRARGIPAQLIEELTKLYLFRLDLRDDIKRLMEMGAPPGIQPPRKDREFLYWTKLDYDAVWGPFKLNLPRKPVAAR